MIAGVVSDNAGQSGSRSRIAAMVSDTVFFRRIRITVSTTSPTHGLRSKRPYERSPSGQRDPRFRRGDLPG